MRSARKLVAAWLRGMADSGQFDTEMSLRKVYDEARAVQDVVPGLGEELTPAVETTNPQSKGRGRTNRVLVSLGIAVGALVISLVSFISLSGRGDGISSRGHSNPFTGGQDIGARWSPNIDPFSNGAETTIAKGTSQAGYPVYRPNVESASDASVSHVWVSFGGPDEGMLPERSQTSLGIAFSSGIQVTYIPWEYGPDAPPFSEVQAASHFQLIASQFPAGAMTTNLIQGVPVLVISSNFGGQQNPGSVEAHLGSDNSNAVTVTVYGRSSEAELTNVMTSIISQWRQAGARAG